MNLSTEAASKTPKNFKFIQSVGKTDNEKMCCLLLYKASKYVITVMKFIIP